MVTQTGFGERSETESHSSGFGDISLGLAKGLLRERNWWPDLIGRVTWGTDFGETSVGDGAADYSGGISLAVRFDIPTPF